MANLIYLTAQGESHTSYALRLISSLRKLGQFQGDIIIFTDNPSSIQPQLKDQAVAIKFNNEDDLHPCNWRLQADDYIDHTNYEFLMYLDVDILCFRPIVDLFKNPGMFSYIESAFDLEYAGPVSHYYFTTSEYNQLKTIPSINSGQYCLSSDLFIEYHQKARQLWKDDPAKRTDIIDQAVLNALIRRGQLNAQVWATPDEIEQVYSLEQPYCGAILRHYRSVRMKPALEHDWNTYIAPNLLD